MESILLVEEDLKILSSIESILTNNNYKVFTARHPIDAVRQICNSAPSAIISDFNLQDSSVYSFLNIVRNDLNFKSTPFFILSSKQNNIGSEIDLDSFTDYIYKPFKSNDILSKIKSKLDNRKLQTINSLKNHNPYGLNFSNQFYQIESQLALLNKYSENLSKDELIDFISRIKINYSRVKSRLEKQAYYNQLQLLENNKSKFEKLSSSKKYELNSLEKIAQQISKNELRESDLALFIDPFEFKTDTDLLNVILNEIIENAFKHSWAFSPVEIIAVDKDDEYIITFTNYSSKKPEFDFDNVENYGMKIIDAACNLLNIRFQITQVTNNCVKSRLTIKQ